MIYCCNALPTSLNMMEELPYGDSSAYDVGIEVNGLLLRVQTKSTTFHRGGTFTFNLVGPGGRAYREGTVWTISRCT